MGTWRSVSSQPTSPEAVEARQRELDQVLSDDTTERHEIILAACTGRHVLDIGCVDHDEMLVDTPDWLHGRIHAVAASCVGLDIHEAGVERMQQLGFEARVVDITQPVPPDLEARGFDTVVAGELIEHLETPIALLRFAAKVLRTGGSLIVTTPNPFSPWRARAGQLGIAWENADHLCYIFPSGMMEMVMPSR